MTEQRLQEIKASVGRIECPECGGSGVYLDGPTGNEACDECDGSGMVSQFPAAGGLIAVPNLIERVRQLEADLAQARAETKEAERLRAEMFDQVHEIQQESEGRLNRAEAAEATIATLREARDDAITQARDAIGENATLREQLAAAQRHIADLTDELYEAQNNPSYDGPSRVVATKRGHCTCWLGTDATFGSSEARMRCAVHGDPPHNVFTQEAQR